MKFDHDALKMLLNLFPLLLVILTRKDMSELLCYFWLY